MYGDVGAVVLERSALSELCELGLFLGSPVGEEVVANNVGVGDVAVPFLNESVGLEEVGQSHVEFLNGGW